MNLISHTAYVVCVNFLYMSCETYSLKSTPKDRFLEKLFMAVLFALRVFVRNFDTDLGLTSDKPTHYLLDHGDFNHVIRFIIGINSYFPHFIQII